MKSVTVYLLFHTHGCHMFWFQKTWWLMERCESLDVQINELDTLSSPAVTMLRSELSHSDNQYRWWWWRWWRMRKPWMNQTSLTGYLNLKVCFIITTKHNKVWITTWPLWIKTSSIFLFCNKTKYAIKIFMFPQLMRGKDNIKWTESALRKSHSPFPINRK